MLRGPAMALAMLAAALLSWTPPATAASKRTIAALGDEAAGGGVFAGPSFTSSPAAAGIGWIAFRTQVAEGAASEQIVVRNVLTGQRLAVAGLGQDASETLGRFRQFLGRPAVNANGDVAFAAVLSPPADLPRSPTLPTPAGIFLYRQGSPAGTYTVIAAPDEETDAGTLDLTTPIDVLTSLTATDIPERTPALNDAGDVAFVSSTIDVGGASAALFLRPAGGALTPLVRLGDEHDGGSFTVLGPPAMNNGGQIAFRALTDGVTTLEGIFRLQNGALSLLVRDGYEVEAPELLPERQDLFSFGETLTMNEAGDVAFTAGPLFEQALGDDDGASAVLVHHAGMNFLIGDPGRPILGRGRITSVNLGAAFGGQVAPPGIAPDGSVIFLASLNGGSSQIVFRAEPPEYDLQTLVVLGGGDPDPTPAGGVYSAAGSAVAVDARLGVVFAARVAGSASPEILVYQPREGDGDAIRIGDALPTPATGFFGGPPFFPPLLNDRGDVVFKSYVARGVGLGIFRFRDGQLANLIGIGSPVPLDGDPAPTVLDLLGQPSLNAAGDVAFNALVEGHGRVVLATGPSGLRVVVATDQDYEDPTRPGAGFRSIAPNPVLSDAGTVVFRATIEYPDPFFPFDLPAIREEGLFLADASGVRALAIEGDPSPAGLPFFRFRDPTVTGSAVTFRASLGVGSVVTNGLFLSDGTALSTIALDGDLLPDGVRIETVSGAATVDAAGEVGFLAKVATLDGTGTVLIKGPPNDLRTLASTGEPGPAGGIFRSIGAPAMGSNGHVAFRGGFEPFTGGVPGYFLVDENGLQPYLLVGEAAPTSMGGRFTSLNQNVALNAGDLATFIASVGGGNARNGIFLASPAGLAARMIDVRVGKPPPPTSVSFKKRDKLRFAALLQPGPTADGFVPESDVVVLSVSDTVGTLWTATIPEKSLIRRGKAFKPRKPRKLRDIVKGLSIVPPREDRTSYYTVTARSPALDLTFGGVRPIVPPLTLRVELGDDSASATVPCTAKGRRLRCGS